MTKKKIIIYTIISSILTLFLSFSYEYDIIKLNNLESSGSWFWCVIFFIFILSLNSISKIRKKNNRILIYSLITATILSILNSIGYSFTNFVLQDIGFTSKLIIYIISKLIVNTFILTTIIMNLYYFIDKYNVKEKSTSKLNKLFEYNKKNYFLIAGLIFLAYVPWLLHYFPGILSPDSTTQISQVAQKGHELTNHHPVFHTLIIGMCLNIGKLIFNSNNAGVAIYSILQMLACAFTFSYAIYYCGKKKVPVFIRQILLFFFMFCPIIASYSVTMWKDIPFALSILITTILLIEAATNNKEFFTNKKNLIILSIFFLLDILFRKNGLYCVILAGIIYLIILAKEDKKKFAIAFIIPVIISFIISGPIFNAFNIKEGDSKEALSVPMQQFARIRKYHSEELTKKEKSELDKFFTDKSYIKLYDPVFADPVKRIFSEEYLKKHKKELVTTYLKYTFKYPSETIKSFIAGSYGYYYPNLVGWEVYNKIYPDPNIKELKIQENPIQEFTVINKLETFLNSHDIPLLSMLTSCGFYFWLLIIIIGYFLYDKRFKIIASFTPLIGVWATALLSPVFCERRYVYSLIITVPVLLVLCFNKKENR